MRDARISPDAPGGILDLSQAILMSITSLYLGMPSERGSGAHTPSARGRQSLGVRHRRGAQESSGSASLSRWLAAVIRGWV